MFPLHHTAKDMCSSSEDSGPGSRPQEEQKPGGMFGLQSAPSEAGRNTYLCIFGNPWACLFAGKSGYLPPWVLEARVAKGHRLEEDQEWAAWGRAEARAGHSG